ncbi:hypothetical protein ACSDQ9_07510 [Aestuariimicrobium soli]|uniref:hypothetical protein n=1 Tax=Aestuariimicrobium soli TaxID=2035834 RepID=UPI003EB9CA22
MKALLTNTNLSDRGGSQRWVETMAREMLRRGWEVKVFCPGPNTLLPWLPPHSSGDTYDLALVNHRDCFREIRRVPIDRLVYTAHGFLPDQEWVPSGADAYVAVSELTAAHIPWRSTVIRNPIDIDHFTEVRPVNRTPIRALILSNRASRARDLIRAACRLTGMELREAGMPNPVDDPAPLINEADIVFTIGRGVPEALACNRNVYAMDWYGAKGYVTGETAVRFRLDNYAGHLDSHWPTAEALARDLTDNYDPNRTMRDYAVAEHAPAGVLDRYLDVASRVPGHRLRAARLMRRLGGPLTTHRLTKLAGYAVAGRPWEGVRAAMSTDQHPPVLIRSRLPDGVTLTSKVMLG